jgi:hypothetical protein
MNPTYKRVTQAALASAMCLLVGGGAQAASVIGTYDPSFGGSLARLGFRGVGNFDVDTGCLTGATPGSTGVWIGNSSSCAMTFLSAQEQLYDFYDPAKPTLQTLNFAGPSFPEPVLGMFIQKIGGVNTVTATYDASGVYGPAGLPGPIYNGPLWLYFVSGHAPIDPAFNVAGTCQEIPDFGTSCTPSGPTSNPASLVWETCTGGPNDGGGNEVCTRFSEAPEPGTLALILGALGGGWFARRRKTAA